MFVKKNITRYLMILAGLLILFTNLKSYDHNQLKIEENSILIDDIDGVVCEIFEHTPNNFDYNVIRLFHKKNVYTTIKEGNDTLFKFSIRETIKGGGSILIKSQNEYFNFIFYFHENLGTIKSIKNVSNFKTLKLINTSSMPLAVNELFLRSHSNGKSICIIIDGKEKYSYIYIIINLVLYSLILIFITLIFYLLKNYYKSNKLFPSSNEPYVVILIILLLTMVIDFRQNLISKNIMLFSTFIILMQFKISIIIRKKLNTILLLILFYLFILFFRTELTFFCDFIIVLTLSILYKLNYNKSIIND